MLCYIWFTEGCCGLCETIGENWSHSSLAFCRRQQDRARRLISSLINSNLRKGVKGKNTTKTKWTSEPRGKWRTKVEAQNKYDILVNENRRVTPLSDCSSHLISDLNRILFIVWYQTTNSDKPLPFFREKKRKENEEKHTARWVRFFWRQAEELLEVNSRILSSWLRVNQCVDCLVACWLL